VLWLAGLQARLAQQVRSALEAGAAEAGAALSAGLASLAGEVAAGADANVAVAREAEAAASAAAVALEARAVRVNLFAAACQGIGPVPLTQRTHATRTLDRPSDTSHAKT
jgi:hypothetical protein